MLLMRSTPAIATLLLVLMSHDAMSFTPSTLTLSVPHCNSITIVGTTTSQRATLVDLSIFDDVHHHLDSFQTLMSYLVLSDASVSSLAHIKTMTDAVTNQAVTGNGWFGFLVAPIEFLLKSIHSGVVCAGAQESAWGLSIIAMTIIIKLGTYPLTKCQLESTYRMKAIQPTLKDIQAKYQSNREVMNTQMYNVYRENRVNPLAGCLPSLIQIPIFIGMYRAVLSLSKGYFLDESFLWLPNLEGPTYGADPAHASDWVLKNWVGGIPPLGWDDTISFLTIPIILIVSQFMSMMFMGSKNQEQPIFLKFVPIMIGWFSLSVPAAVGVYWVTNNFITTALTLHIQSGFGDNSDCSPGARSKHVTPTTFIPTPMRENLTGVSATSYDCNKEDEAGSNSKLPLLPRNLLH